MYFISVKYKVLCVSLLMKTCYPAIKTFLCFTLLPVILLKSLHTPDKLAHFTGVKKKSTQVK